MEIHVYGDGEERDRVCEMMKIDDFGEKEELELE